MLGLIRDAWDRVARFLTCRKGLGGGKGPAPARGTPSSGPAAGTSLAQGSVPGLLDREGDSTKSPALAKAGDMLSPAPGDLPEVQEGGAATADHLPRGPPFPVPESVPAHSRWHVTESAGSPFEKCGRVFITGDTLVVRTDLDTRGFCIPLADLDRALAGDGGPILVLSTGEPAGVAVRSASGRAVNFLVGTILYTVPVKTLKDVWMGRARKAAVFVGKGG